MLTHADRCRAPLEQRETALPAATVEGVLEVTRVESGHHLARLHPVSDINGPLDELSRDLEDPSIP